MARPKTIAARPKKKSRIGNLVYLASPFTSKDKAMEEYRFVAVAIAAGWAMNHYPDLRFFSPITHTHPIGSHCKLPGSWPFWAAYDKCMLSRCDEFWVLCLPGFETSVGVNAERKLAAAFGLPIRFLVPNSDDGYVLSKTEPSIQKRLSSCLRT